MKTPCPDKSRRTTDDATLPTSLPAAHQNGFRYNRQAGVTLVEVVIVVAIIGILAGFALPAYTSHIQQQRRMDAHQMLHENASRLQRCLTLAGAFNGPCNLLTTSIEGHYTLSSTLTTLTTQTWQLTVTPATGSPQANDTDCQTISLDHRGNRSATGGATETCW